MSRRTSISHDSKETYSKQSSLLPAPVLLGGPSSRQSSSANPPPSSTPGSLSNGNSSTALANLRPASKSQSQSSLRQDEVYTPQTLFPKTPSLRIRATPPAKIKAENEAYTTSSHGPIHSRKSSLAQSYTADSQDTSPTSSPKNSRTRQNRSHDDFHHGSVDSKWTRLQKTLDHATDYGHDSGRSVNNHMQTNAQGLNAGLGLNTFDSNNAVEENHNLYSGNGVSALSPVDEIPASQFESNMSNNATHHQMNGQDQGAETSSTHNVNDIMPNKGSQSQTIRIEHSHAAALQELRIAQLNLAEAWRVSTSSLTPAPLDPRQDAVNSNQQTNTTSSKDKTKPRTMSNSSTRQRDNLNRNEKEDHDDDDLDPEESATSRRVKNDAYFAKVKQSVADIVAKLDAVGDAMRNVEQRGGEVWDERARGKNGTPRMRSGSFVSFVNGAESSSNSRERSPTGTVKVNRS